MGTCDCCEKKYKTLYVVKGLLGILYYYCKECYKEVSDEVATLGKL